MKTFAFNKIVLVDDDGDDRLLFKDSVHDNLPGVAVDLYDNPQQFLSDIEGKGLEDTLVFLDLNMPTMHGLDCLQIMKEAERLKEIPVIIYSTSRNEGEINKAYSLGANLYLTKPNSFNDIGNVIEKVLNFNWREYIPQPKRNEFVLFPG